MCRSSASIEQRDGILKSRCQFLHFGHGVVKVEACAEAGDDSEPLVERHCTVLSGPNRYPVAVQHVSDVMRMNAIHYEANDSRLSMRFRTKNPQTANA